MSEQINGEIQELEVSGKKGVSAKEVSKWSMIVSAIWIAVWSVVKAIWPLFAKGEFGLTMWEIILSGLFIAAVFSPVYFAIFMDKVKDIKIGGAK